MIPRDRPVAGFHSRRNGEAFTAELEHVDALDQFREAIAAGADAGRYAAARLRLLRSIEHLGRVHGGGAL